MAAAAQFSATSLSERLQLEVQRAIERNFKGLEVLGAPAPAVGTTPKTVLHRRGVLRLDHYHAQAAEVYRVPVLLVMAPTNKAFVFDMAPGQSLIEYLLQRGHDVYAMDWHAPTQRESNLQLEDYTLDFIPDCVRRVQQDSGVEEVSVLGYCAGGLLSAIYAALHPDGPMKNLVTITVPVDFSKMELFRRMTDPQEFNVDKMIDADGIVPGDIVARMFSLLRPASDIANQIRLWDNLWNDAYVKQYRLLERWTAETLPLPGGYARQTVKELLQKNSLYEGTLRIRGRLVDLSRITAPFLSFVAQYDHIVPPACARPLYERVGSRDKEEVVLPGGHVSLVAGPNAIKRMWPKLNEWLERRST
jgi:polyhydroxyalkanoate synthase subunit PhaC